MQTGGMILLFFIFTTLSFPVAMWILFALLSSRYKESAKYAALILAVLSTAALIFFALMLIFADYSFLKLR